MKNVLKLGLILLSLGGLAACGGGNTATSGSTSGQQKEMCEEDKIYQKLWEAKTIYNESCVMIEQEDGSFSSRLVYTPTKIIEVKNYSLQKVYDPSEYRLEGDRIVLNKTEKTTIPFLTQKNINCDEVPELIGGTYASNKAKSGKILFTEGVGIIMYQIAVTYETNELWYGSIPVSKGEKLPKLQEKLKNKEDINFVVNGDSIFTGCNSSGIKGIEPFLDPFDQGFAKEITRNYGNKVTVTNTAVGGQVSDWGKKNVVANVNNFNPDLVLIGFGMNDGSFNVHPDVFLDNISFMIQSIQANCENAEIIVAATIIANPNSSQNSIQEQYLPKLLTLEETYEGVAVLDMTTYSKDLLQKKNSLELYANNINHPCDFMVRGYVSNLMNLIEIKK